MATAAGLYVEVHAGGDVHQEERLLANLQGDLKRIDGLQVTLAPPAPAAPGSKGTAEIVALLVAGIPLARPTADAVARSIEAWCARDPRRRVRIRDGEDEIEITGGSAQHQRELADRFWRARRKDG